MINAHGGKLINQFLNEEKKGQILDNLDSFFKIKLSEEQAKDVENIANGVYSPLEGFLKMDDFENVCQNMRLSDGIVWPIPIILDINEKNYKNIKGQKEILLLDENKKPLALLEDIEIYPFNKALYTKNVFGTTDRKHPGVEDAFNSGDYLVGGKIKLLDKFFTKFKEYNKTPKDTRNAFTGRGWNNIVAFQTRNIPHTGHEFLQKNALQQVDGLFIQPVIGKKKADDFSDESILSTYEILIEKYYPKNKVLLGILPLKMRYAGPREALMHALIRKNYGCSHFIVGRDHAGVKGYYKPFEAHDIFEKFNKDEIGIEIFKYPEVVYDKMNQKLCFLHECEEENRESFSGTKLRKYIEDKTPPPPHIVRPEVYNYLTGNKNTLLEEMQNGFANSNKGFVLWLTGLSQSGKSTVADKVYELLKERGIKTERLDGDIVREYFSKGLGFSKEDRQENIRRVGFISKLLSRNGVAVISSFISPYKKQRDELRIGIEGFIEVFVDTPIEVCEQRDKKGIYQKARKGEIKNFTGIDDPYEKPEKPDIHIKGAEMNVEQCAEKIIDYLQKNNFID